MNLIVTSHRLSSLTERLLCLAFHYHDSCGDLHHPALLLQLRNYYSYSVLIIVLIIINVFQHNCHALLINHHFQPSFLLSQSVELIQHSFLRFQPASKCGFLRENGNHAFQVASGSFLPISPHFVFPKFTDLKKLIRLFTSSVDVMPLARLQLPTIVSAVMRVQHCTILTISFIALIIIYTDCL